MSLSSKATYLDEHPELKPDTDEFTRKISAIKEAYINGSLPLTMLELY
jgi:hypothetical protein